MKPPHALAFSVLLLGASFSASCSDSRAPRAGAHSLDSEWLVAGQANETFHGSSVGELHCDGCHATARFCSRCHFGPSGSRAPAGSAWTHPQTAGHQALAAFGDVCTRCHAAERRSGAGPAPCHDCHGEALPHALGAGWMLASQEFHGTSLLRCQSCHGPRDDFCGRCHFGENGSRNPTGVEWSHDRPMVGHSEEAIQAFGAVCTRCHRIEAELRGVPAETECGNCHDREIHALPYLLDHAPAALANEASCAGCHPATGLGAGPACSACHTAASPLTASNCTSCHGAPPDGASRPNVAAAHGAHGPLVGPDGCVACHAGAGVGTTEHFDGAANVRFGANYDAKSGPAAYDPSTQTCTNTTCHGGRVTPSWGAGSLDRTACASCHTPGEAQYNGYFSGEHRLHVEEKRLACSYCHGTVELDRRHFVAMETPTIEPGSAGRTVGGVPLLPAYDPATRTCTTLCHAQEPWF